MQKHLSKSLLNSTLKLSAILLFVSLAVYPAHSQPQEATPAPTNSDANRLPDPPTSVDAVPSATATPTPSPSPTPKAIILVKRRDAPDSSYGNSASVAAGAIATPEHQADVRVKITDASGKGIPGVSVNAPTILDSAGKKARGYKNVNTPSITPAIAITDSNGIASFSFTSSDVMAKVTLHCDQGNASATISQDWDAANDWGDSDYSFIIGEPSKQEFLPRLGDGHPNPEIKGHQIDFQVEGMALQYWWKGKWRTRHLRSSNVRDRALIDHLATIRPSYDSKPENGDYRVEVTANEDAQHLVDDMNFHVTDITVWLESYVKSLAK